MATTSSVNWHSNDHYYSKVTPFLGDYTPASCHFSAGRSTISRQSQVKTGRRLHLLDLNTLDNRLTQTDLTLVKTRCSKTQWGARESEEAEEPEEQLESPLRQLDNRSNYTKHTNQLQLGDPFQRCLAAGALGKRAATKCFALISKRMRKRRNIFIRQEKNANCIGQKIKTSCKYGIQSG